MSGDPNTVTAGGVTVRCAGEEVTAARDSALAANLGVAARIAGKDAGVWGPEAAAEASVRLGWLDCATVSRPLVAQIAELRSELSSRGVERVVLAGMGGSSLAPEVIAATYGVELTTLDTTDPGQVSAALTDLQRTVLVVSSKSGSTIETDSHRRAFEQAFRDAGIDPVERIVVVTDPDSPLHRLAAEAGYFVFEADPNVGGRYSALTAFGLVPSGLAGVPVDELLDAAEALSPTLAGDYGNAAVALGAALGGYGVEGHDKVVIADGGSGIQGFGDWAEQLIAESTGKSGRGLLPVVVATPDSPGFRAASDTHLVTIGSTPPADGGTAVDGSLGAQFLAWEFATAVAGRLLAIDPFNQPNVQESKDNTKAVLEAAKDGPLPTGDPLFADGPIEVYGNAADIGGAQDVAGVVAALLAGVPDNGYLAVMAYLDRLSDTAVAGIRDLLAARTTHPVTFGWGPRFLHSTGQFHKGGPPVGVFLQITGDSAIDLDIPGQPFSFGRLQMAQALGDLQALHGRSRPAVRLHLTDRVAGTDALLTAVRAGA
ncbi:MAG TPA: glucose-6-phosphate isomerase [Mycobacteriales bacterium]|nr:glucose-6-phosphate isomerase [Mycobacteriales bacterium]